MLKRMVLVVVLLAAVTVTPIVNAENARASILQNWFAYRFTCTPGWCWQGLYNLSQGTFEFGVWHEPGTHEWSVVGNYSKWYGLYIYDDSTGQWVGAYYVYIEEL